MTLSRSTWILLGIVGALALLLALPSVGGGRGVSLPVLPAIDPDVVTRVTFETAGQPIVIEKQGEAWRLLQPLQADADASSLASLLAGFRQPVPMDARVDTGHLDTYELDDNKGVRFEVFTGGSEPVLAVMVGRDVEGGSTLLRLSGSDDVYRARIGGAFRFRKDASQWRNRSVLDLDDTLVGGLTVEGAAGVLTFVREPSGDVQAEERPPWAPWHLQRDPAFPVDQRILEALARSLTRLRASAVHAPDFGSGWDRPTGAYEVALSDGTTHRIVVVPASDGVSGLVRVDGLPDVYRVAGSLLERLEKGEEEYRDRTLFAFAVEQVDTLTLEEGSARVRIRQDPGSRLWRVVEPVSTEVDLRTALLAIRTMGELRAAGVAEGVDPRQAGLVPPRARFEARLIDGSSQVLEVGARIQDGGQDRVWVRRAGRDTVWVLPAEAVKRMRAAFLQG